jgi:tRNA-Thr(GGU) m(6)t(6)A37 methyltransferase TsaA
LGICYKESGLNEIVFQPIGIIHTPFHDIEGMPIQASGAQGIKGVIDIFPEYGEGLADLDGFSHIIILYHFHKTSTYNLTVVPFLDDKPHGVFATRAPKRPNPIGISVVKLERIVKNELHVVNVDILDGTPLLDIKPFVPDFDHHEITRSGWFRNTGGYVKKVISDDRFK